MFWEPLRSSPADIAIGMVVIGVLGLLNVVGVKEAAGVNIVLALIDLVTQLILVVIGVVLVLSPETLVEEAREFGTTIPRAMHGVHVAVIAVYATLPAVALSAMPVEDGRTLLGLTEEEGGYAGDPVL